MVKVSKEQLKIVDIVEEKNDIKPEEESPINNDAQELNNIKQEIENNETNEEKTEEQIEEKQRRK